MSDELIALNEEYLHLISEPRSRLRSIKEHFDNCLVFRASLYILRNQLLGFIEDTFTKHINDRRRPIQSPESLISEIRRNIRTPPSQRKQLKKKADERRQLIRDLRTTEIRVDWQTFAL